jgi:MFS family permease
MRPNTLLLNLFFWSGATALIYQAAWQRMLFVAFGVDLESVTIVVTTFMLGLGVGGILGGQLADRFPRHLIRLFALAEVTIGIFGLASPVLLAWVGEAAVNQGLLVTALVNMLVMLIPAAAMGMTLPLLVAHQYRFNRNVGQSTGVLYFANTLGASVGTFCFGFVLLMYFDLNEMVRMAAAVNFLVAAICWFAFRKDAQTAAER